MEDPAGRVDWLTGFFCCLNQLFYVNQQNGERNQPNGEGNRPDGMKNRPNGVTNRPNEEGYRPNGRMNRPTDPIQLAGVSV